MAQPLYVPKPEGSMAWMNVDQIHVMGSNGFTIQHKHTHTQHELDRAKCWANTKKRADQASNGSTRGPIGNLEAHETTCAFINVAI